MHSKPLQKGTNKTFVKRHPSNKAFAKKHPASYARRQRRLAAGISSSKEDEDEEWEWDWEEGWQGQSQGWGWKDEEEKTCLRQPPMPPRPNREGVERQGKGSSSSTGPAGFEKSTSLESSNSNTGHVAKRGRVGPRATSSPPVPVGTKIVGGERQKNEKMGEKKGKKGKK